MSHEDGQRCATCKHWTGNREQPQKGQCRRFPPSPGGIVNVQNLLSRQPQPAILWGSPEPEAGFWCGEWVAVHELVRMAS